MSSVDVLIFDGGYFFGIDKFIEEAEKDGCNLLKSGNFFCTNQETEWN